MTTTKSVCAATAVLELLTHIRAIFDPDGLLVAPHALPEPAAASREPVC